MFSSARQAWRVHRELNNGTSKFASHSPDLSPTSKVSLLELPARGPSTCAISRANDGTPVRASLPGRSDADELVGCGCDHNLEAVADLKIAAGTARIEQTYERNLGGRGNNSQNQSEQDHPHNARIRVHSNRAICWPNYPRLVAKGLPIAPGSPKSGKSSPNSPP